MRAMRLRLILAMASALLFAAPSRAEDVHDNHAQSADAGHDAQGGHKAELLHWDIGAALWSIAVFVILLLILRFAAWKPILAGLTQREQFITNSIAQARNEREAAAKLLADYQAKLQSAHQEAGAIMDEGRRDAEETRKRMAGEAKAEADAIVARAKKDIELARDEAVKTLHDQTIQLATTVAGKLIRRELTPGDQQALLNESLSELSRMN